MRRADSAIVMTNFNRIDPGKCWHSQNRRRPIRICDQFRDDLIERESLRLCMLDIFVRTKARRICLRPFPRVCRDFSQLKLGASRGTAPPLRCRDIA